MWTRCNLALLSARTTRHRNLLLLNVLRLAAGLSVTSASRRTGRGTSVSRRTDRVS